MWYYRRITFQNTVTNEDVVIQLIITFIYISFIGNFFVVEYMDVCLNNTSMGALDWSVLSHLKVCILSRDSIPYVEPQQRCNT